MNPCPCCNTPMHEYTQKSMFPERPSFQLAECHTPICKLFMVTLTKGAHQLLTPLQIAGYAKVNRNQQKAAV